MHSESLILHTGVPIPRQLIANVRSWDQEAITPGWLESLPDTVAQLCAKWHIDLEPEGLLQHCLSIARHLGTLQPR